MICTNCKKDVISTYLVKENNWVCFDCSVKLEPDVEDMTRLIKKKNENNTRK